MCNEKMKKSSGEPVQSDQRPWTGAMGGYKIAVLGLVTDGVSYVCFDCESYIEIGGQYAYYDNPRFPRPTRQNTRGISRKNFVFCSGCYNKRIEVEQQEGFGASLEKFPG